MKSNDGAIYVDKNAVSFQPLDVILVLIGRVFRRLVVEQLSPRISVAQPYGRLTPLQQYVIFVQGFDLNHWLPSEPILPMREESDASTDIIDDGIIHTLSQQGRLRVQPSPHVEVVA